jgi:hypothetical protein
MSVRRCLATLSGGLLATLPGSQNARFAFLFAPALGSSPTWGGGRHLG